MFEKGFILTLVGTLSSIISLVVSLRMAKQREEAPKPTHLKQHSWPIVLILLVTVASFCLSVIWFISSGKYLGWGVLVTFIVSLISLIIYGIKANHSLDTYDVLPPRSLWQVLFNKIPSHIEYANQLVFKFLVLKMDNSDEVEKAGQTIKNNYKERKDFHVDVLTLQEFQNLQSQKDSSQPPKVSPVSEYCGVIFIVGKECYHRQNEVLELMDEYSKQLALPIAYIGVGVDYYRLRKYQRISYQYLDNSANHLIMRIYRRSEHWIRLSKMSHVALWTALFFALAFFISSLLLGRKVFDQNGIIQTQKVDIKELESRQRGFGLNRSLIHLPNFYLETNLPDIVEIDSLRESSAFNAFVDGFSKYMFGEVEPTKILLWLRNDTNEPLACIYDSSRDLKVNSHKDGKTMIGGIANQAGTFVLWPGSTNNDTVWLNQNITMAWYNEDNGDFEISELIRENQRNVGLRLSRHASDKEEIRLEWFKNDKRDFEENGLALFGYSYDGRLAIELDYENDVVNDKDKREYIQHLVFRNTVRKFSVCITSYIKSHQRTVIN